MFLIGFPMEGFDMTFAEHTLVIFSTQNRERSWRNFLLNKEVMNAFSG